MAENSRENNNSPRQDVKEYHKAFYELCYQQYINEFARTDSLHNKMGIWLTAILAIGAASYTLGRTDLLNQIRSDTFVFLFYVITVFVWGGLLSGSYFVYESLRLRTTKMIATMDRWNEWLEQVDNKENPPDAEREIEIRDTFIKNLIRDISVCQGVCFEQNEKRYKSFKWMQRMTFVSFMLLVFQAILSVIVIVVK